MNIIGQKVVGFELDDPKGLSDRIADTVDICKREHEPNSLLIHQVIKASEREYVVILYVVE